MTNYEKQKKTYEALPPSLRILFPRPISPLRKQVLSLVVGCGYYIPTIIVLFTLLEPENMLAGAACFFLPLGVGYWMGKHILADIIVARVYERYMRWLEVTCQVAPEFAMILEGFRHQYNDEYVAKFLTDESFRRKELREVQDRLSQGPAYTFKLQDTGTTNNVEEEAEEDSGEGSTTGDVTSEPFD